MGKQQSSPKGAAAATGRGEVTPVEIAFLVDRYLADNGFSATLASFHSEAAEIFAKTMTREAPKRLLTLAHILDEYVSLKGQRIAVEQEKRRVEALLGGIQDAVNAYRSGGEPHPPLPSPPQMSPPAPPPTPAVVPTPAPAPSGRIASANPGNRYRTGPLVPQIPLVRSSPVVVPSKVPQASSISPPLGNNTRSNKRKNSKPVLKAPAAPKKHRGQSQADVSALEGTRGPSESDGANRTEQPVHQKSPACNLPSNSDRNPDPFVERSSVAKSPSVQSPDSDINSTPPKTPQQACSSQSQKMAPFLASSSSCQSASASKELTPSECSITSSKTVVVSPYKKECYYTVQKSCRITSSPLKASPRRAGIRDCVKSRLDFDDSDLPLACENPALAGSPNSLIDDKLDDIFNFDISDFDMDFSFAELLVNGDLDCGEFTGSCQPAIKSSADSISRSEEAAANACLGMSQDVPVPCLTSMSEIMSEEAMRVTEGHDSVASVKTITKCIKIVSPAKGRRNSCLEPLEP